MLVREVRRIPPHAVDRPGLRAQLDRGLSAPLSLVVAPAGAGKTVLLSQWMRARPDVAVAWFDVTPGDDAAQAFARRLVDGIAAVVRDFAEPSAPVRASEGRLGEAFLEDLAAGLSDAGTIALVFDDLDALSGSPILTDLWRLVDLLPPNAHIIFSSRVDLQLGWSRHRLEHGLVEIRQRELAFDDCTTASVIETITGRTVAESTVAAVTTRTEGWAVGVQLTALTLRFAPDPARIVDTLAETDRLVIDYLSAEVLEALTPSRRDSLIRLALLDEICAGLVEAVTGEDGPAVLAALERDSMFLVPVPGKPGWYRFHRLFRDLLLYRLRAIDGRVEAQVLEAAADWYLDRGEGETAVQYLLRARRWERVLDEVLASGREVYEEVRTPTLARWLREVPAEVRATRVEAELLLALAEGMSGQATFSIDTLRGLLAGDRLSIGQRQSALAYLSACVQFHPHAETFRDAAREALVLLDAHPASVLPDLMGLTSRPLLGIVARGSLGRAHLLLGDLGAARRELGDVLESTGIAYAPFRVHALGSLAVAEALSGSLVSAAERADEALETARQFDLLAHPAPADAYLARAIVAIQRDEPDVGALSLAEGGIRAAANNRTQLMWLAHVASLLVDPAGSHSVTEPPGSPPPVVRQSLTAIGMRRARLRGAPVAPPAPASTWSAIAFEEVAALLTEGHAAAAHARLAQLRFAPDPLAPLPTIEWELLLGWTCAAEGSRAGARDHFAVALALAEPEWLAHPFVRAGPLVADLVEELPEARTEFGRLVVARARTTVSSPEERLVDDLTPRELELLAYLPSRLTIADIAARCFVSTNTVKTHLGHIYRKLGVAGRDAAIDRAVELRLLDSREIARVG